VKQRGGKFGVVGSNHTTNEENYYLQKMARLGLGTEHIDHHRTGDVVSLLRTQAPLATTADVYNSKAVLIVGSDLSQQHPLLAYQVRANWRHHQAHIYTVRLGPVREDKIAARIVSVEPGCEIPGLESLRTDLAKEPELVILFGDAIKGEAVARLVAFGNSLGIPVKYVCLLDYSNSRGAVDMGLVPIKGGMTLPEMMAAGDLDALWVVGANPLKIYALAGKPFVVVQDMFLTETAQAADVVLPAAPAYEKSGTVTNVCGEVQRLQKAFDTPGTKPDLEIFRLIAREMGLDLPELGGWTPDDLARAAVAPVESAGDTLFTSGTLGRYSQKLNAVREAPGESYRG
jgi:NADH-quinone oxidoreductase subunit G